MVSRTFTAKMKRHFPTLGTSNECIFRPDINVIETDDYIVGYLDGRIIIGKITVERKVIKSIITVKIHTGKGLGNRKHLITISNIICFTRTLTPKRLREELPEFFI